MDEESVDPDTH